jgi:signal peptidase I
MFQPKWKKEGELLLKGAKKFLHYKRDLLKPDRIDEIESRRGDLKAALTAGDRAKAEEAGKQLRATCENALPHPESQGWIEENVEVIFVAIVIALGLRAYYLQPFRIPTGSMQPTLNGIIGKELPKEQWPSLPVRWAQQILRGTSYVRAEVKQDKRLRAEKPLEERPVLHFFTRTWVHFDDGTKLKIPAPLNVAVTQLGLGDKLGVAGRSITRRDLPKGTVLAEGTVSSGDLVLVDKFSYHFRRPQRGEVFVFDTRGIRGIHDRHFGGQEAGSHYIKRLCGVPGDNLTIESPNLLVDGRIASEPGIQRVIGQQGEYALNPGYQLADPLRDNGAFRYLDQPGKPLTLRLVAPPGLREYAALGDNTGNSLDSRYWGQVREFNLVGPALFSLWPFTTGHWGLIR